MGAGQCKNSGLDFARREGGAPCAAGDLPDGGGGNPTGIVPDYSGKDWVAEIADTAGGLTTAGRRHWNGSAMEDESC